MSKHKGTHPAPALTPAQANPALWGYGFGATLIALGLLILSIALGSALRSATRGVHRFTFPEERTLTLKEGLYVGILPAAKKGRETSPADLDVAITDAGGAPVQQMAFPPELAQANGKLGTTLFQARVPFDDEYAVRGRLAPGAPGPAEFLLVHESLSRNPSDILVGAILMAVLGGFGLYIIFMTYRRGRRPSAPQGGNL